MMSDWIKLLDGFELPFLLACSFIYIIFFSLFFDLQWANKLKRKIKLIIITVTIVKVITLIMIDDNNDNTSNRNNDNNNVNNSSSNNNTNKLL